MKRFNFIFTGHYLKFWYIAFVIVIGLMALKWLSSVDTYTVIVYDPQGNIASQYDVSKQEAERLRRNYELPMSKAFIPHK